MTAVAALKAKLGMDSRDFQRGAEEAAESTDKVTKSLKETKEEGSKLGDALGEVGGPLGDIGDKLSGPTGIVGAFGAAGVAVFELGRNFADTATEVETIAQVTGDTVENASRMRAVFEGVGIEANDLADIALQTAGSLEGNAELAERLGIAIDGSTPPAEQLRQTIAQWDLLTPTERAQAFGEEGVRQIGRLIASGEDLEDLLADVGPGQIFTAQDIADAQDFQESMREIKALGEEIALVYGREVVQSLNDVKFALDGVTVAFGDTENGMRVFRAIATAGFSEIRSAIENTGGEGERLESGVNTLAINAGRKLGNLTDDAEDVGVAFDDIRAPVIDLQAVIDYEFGRMTETINEFKNELDMESEFLDVQDALDEARYRSDESWRDQQRDIINAKQTVLDYAETLEVAIPPEKITDILTMIEEGSLLEAQRVIRELTEPEVKDIIIRTVQGTTETRRFGPGGGSGRIIEGAGQYGGVMSRSPFLVGEEGPEIVSFRAGQPFVHTAAQSASIMRANMVSGVPVGGIANGAPMNVTMVVNGRVLEGAVESVVVGREALGAAQL